VRLRIYAIDKGMLYERPGNVEVQGKRSRSFLIPIIVFHKFEMVQNSRRSQGPLS
jgi:hypothetical protein